MVTVDKVVCDGGPQHIWQLACDHEGQPKGQRLRLLRHEMESKHLALLGLRFNLAMAQILKYL
eukprot:scaffold66153_cov45-Prasinocladus_malaysianus.AAC.1